MKLKGICMFAVLMIVTGFLFFSASAYADIITVCQPSGCDSDTIQGGIDLAVSGDTVQVAGKKGGEFYYENVVMNSGITLEGGYNKIDFSMRDTNFYETIIDGNGLTGNVVTASYVSDVTIDGFTIQNGYNGGIHLSRSDTVTISGNTITGNSVNNSSGNGGGIYALGGSGPVTISGNTITGNSVNAYLDGNGGGIYASSAVTISGNTITGNSSNGDGGGIYSRSISNISNNIIAANSANVGGGIYLTLGAGVIVNNTITANSASNSAAGIYISSATITIKNTISYANNGEDLFVAGGSVSVQYSNVCYTDGTTPYPGSYNMCKYPLFVDPENNDYHIQSSSLMIDVGTNVDCPVDDIDGDARPNGNFCDIGADEFFNQLPVISSFILSDQESGDVNYTNSRSINVAVAAYDPDQLNGIQSWLLTENINVPASYTEFINWGATTDKPANYLLGDFDGSHTVYAWVMDNDGNIGLPIAKNIILDTIEPGLVSAIATSNNTVEISFSEVVLANSATNESNYSFLPDSLTIETIVPVGQNGDTYAITTNDHTEQPYYTITANNIKDLAGNVIDNDNNTANFQGYDDISPKIVSVNPPDNAEQIVTYTDIIIEFSEVMDQSSIEMSVKNADNTVVDGEITWDGNKAVFNPVKDLWHETTYSVRIDTTKDLAGNNMASVYMSSFTTQEFPSQPAGPASEETDNGPCFINTILF